ncbi:ALP1-like protein isoform X1 [Tanacetum coccineum]
MNQNRTVFDIDEKTDAFYLQKAVEYHEWLIQQEAQPRLTRTPIFRDREDAERRLRADYFDDHSAIRQMAYGSTPDAFDEYLQMILIVCTGNGKIVQCHGKVNTVGVIFLACKQYGHVVDSYIPVKKSKYGKRFGFVKFINVFSEERLVNNLCTVWIGRVRLHANIARFQRPMVRT